MNYLTKRINDVLVFNLVGDLSPDALEKLKDQMQALMKREHKILFNFRQVSDIGRPAIDGLLLMVNQINRVGGHLRICGLNTKISTIFSQMGVNNFLEIFRTQDDALAAFS